MPLNQWYTKDVLDDCRGYVAESVRLCGNVMSRDGKLGDLIAKIRDHLLNVVKFARDVITPRRRNDEWRRKRVWIGSTYTKIEQTI